METRSIEAIVRALNDAKVKYLIVGGLAVNAYGYERLTNGIDLVIGLKRQNIIRGLRALEKIDYHMIIPVSPEQFANPVTRETWRREKNMIVLKLWSDVHHRTPVDVFVYEPFDFAKEYAGARRDAIIGGVQATIIGYEALLAMKRAAGRDKDLLDIKTLRKLDPYR